MPMTFLVALIPEPEMGGFVAEVPAMPGCFSEGESVEESLENVREAIEGCLIVKYKYGKSYTADPSQRVSELRSDGSVRFYDVTVDEPKTLYENEFKVAVRCHRYQF